MTTTTRDATQEELDMVRIGVDEIKQEREDKALEVYEQFKRDSKEKKLVASKDCK